MEMHQNEANRWVHVLGFLVSWVFVGIGIMHHPMYFIGVPISYSLAFFGHLLFERNEPTFVMYMKNNKFSVRMFLFLVLVEEISILLITLEQFSIVRKKKRVSS